MKQLSDYLKVELIDVMEVATFYSMINTKPFGKNVISVCKMFHACLMVLMK
ncbi:MAG: hypothetical protein Ct9H90mP18_03010 [Gammaproteobacteria bacterium]|nr:MAG: hypothetical protein Ct9H90mP18_03010 [Gammaproteobacteria bacterium]